MTAGGDVLDALIARRRRGLPRLGENTARGFMKYACCDAKGPRTVQCEGLVPGVGRSES